MIPSNDFISNKIYYSVKINKISRKSIIAIDHRKYRYVLMYWTGKVHPIVLDVLA